MAERHYDAHAIEARWQRVWAEERTWEVANEGASAGRRESDGRRAAGAAPVALRSAGTDGAAELVPASYVLEMLPYPSGEPHIGHLKCYALGDAIAHFRRRTGHRVLHPMGYDAFGLPAENYAIETGVHPRESTRASIAAFQEQFHSWGISIDWSRELATDEPSYYRWTQWIFLELYRAGLAYRKEAAVKWCPNDQTVLANEQVIDGCCERCGAKVEARQLEQWFFRITDYAERLLRDLDDIEWPEYVKIMQRNWIGRSEGAEVIFRSEELGIDYPVFTTRPDTLFGATFFVLAPEHPDVMRLVAGTPREHEVREYINRALTESSEVRGTAERPKTGVFLGRTVTNPVNGERLPMYVADYVLMEYGTGAIMAVPAHDERDYEFARTFELPIRRVIEAVDGDEGEGAGEPPTADPLSGLPYTGDGVLVNSNPEFDGLPNREALELIVDWLEREGKGHATVSYRLRDWLISRQRYWGCPIPIVYCDRCGVVPVPEQELPVRLPDIEDYAPKGRSPLATAEEWVNVPCPACDGEARRETDTMDTFVDSSWYFMRYCDARNEHAAFEPSALREWMPVDQYIGGVEHAILHLMYARFITKALADLGHVDFQEPFRALFTQGMITKDGAKMSKSRGNVVSPATIVGRYGADTARCYILFMGPPAHEADWSDEGVEGVYRFLSRLWRLTDETAQRRAGLPAATGLARVDGDDLALLRKSHWAIDKVSNDLRRFAFNTAIAAIMELLNECSRLRETASLETLALALSTAGSLLLPFAPHLASEIYERLTGERVWETPWPQADPSLLEHEVYELVCQVNGKLRDRVSASAEAGPEELKELCRGAPNVGAHINGKHIVKEIVVPGKLVNLVVR
jgi:leucyl-tRNA synthetase